MPCGFNLSMMYVPASMNEEDRKILDSDNDDNLPSIRQILVSSKRLKRVIGFDSERSDGNTRTAQY
jgi:hypothetical protein